MILRPHKADQFVVDEPEYTAILSTYYAEYKRHLATKAENNLSAHTAPVWLDIGAHIGSAALKIIKHGASLIYCFEPEPFNYALLCKNTYYYDEIVPMNNAIVGAGSNRELVLWANMGTNTGRHSLAGGLANTHKVSGVLTEALTFAYALSATNAKCAKIDIEGSEHLFFDELLESELEFVMMEYHCDKTTQEGFVNYMHVETAEHYALKKGWEFHIVAKNEEYKTYIVVMTRYKNATK